MEILYDDSGETSVGGIKTANVEKVVLSESTAHCVMPFIPYRLRENTFYQQVNTLICIEDDKFSDQELRTFLDARTEFVRSGLHTSYISLNWFSQSTWVEAGEYNWTDSQTAGSNFTARVVIPRTTNLEIWKDISNVVGEAFNEDGFNIWSKFIEPYTGTNLIQRQLLKHLRLDGIVKDWYNDSAPVNTYSFVFREFPGWERTKTLILASQVLKNVESSISTVKDENCPHALILSEGYLDSDFVSDIYGDKYYGSYICFQRFITQNFEVFSQLGFEYTRTRTKSDGINYWQEIFLSDNLYLSEPKFDRYFRTHVSLTPGKFVQLMPAYLKDLDNKWSPIVTWENYNTWDGIEITNMVRTRLYSEIPFDWTYINPVNDLPQTWETFATWEGDVVETLWQHNRPCSGTDCIVNRNFIPYFEQSTGRSLYEVIVFSNHISDFDQNADILIANEYLAYWWDTDTTLGYMLLDEPLSTTVHVQKTSITV